MDTSTVIERILCFFTSFYLKEYLMRYITVPTDNDSKFLLLSFYYTEKKQLLT